MKCEEVGFLLEQFFDGELPTELAREVDHSIQTCAHCQEELALLEAVRNGIQEPILEELSQVSFDGLWDGIEQGISGPAEHTEKTPVATPVETKPIDKPVETPSMWSRWMTTLRDNLRLPSWAPAAVGACAVILAVVGIWNTLPEHSKTQTPVLTAQNTETNEMGEMGEMDEMDEIVPGETINLAWVSGVDVRRGFIIIDQIQDDPTQPVIIWHIDDEKNRLKGADG